MDYSSLVQTVAPTIEPVTADDIQTFGEMPAGQNAPQGANPALLTALCKAARKWCEDFTGKQFITATWALYLDCFPWDETIWLPRGPWQSTGFSIAYLDTDGDSQSVSSSDYRLDTNSGRVTPAYRETWPSTRDVTAAITVTFKSGYGDDADDVPDGIKQAIKTLALDCYVNRARSVFDIPATVKALLFPFWDGKM